MRISMEGKVALLIGLLSLFGGIESRAATVELSGLVAFGKADFEDGYKSDQRRYTGSIDFKFTSVSALQLEYTDSYTEVSYPINLSSMLIIPRKTTQTISYRDKIYSFNWVQNLVPSKWIVQPYFVVGGGKMQRKVDKAIPELGIAESDTQNVTTGTGGVGLRIFLTRSMAVKGEIKTYVPKFQFSKWKENQLLSVGLSWVF
jgi:hypothetical protein